jgi:hypothetical protein
VPTPTAAQHTPSYGARQAARHPRRRRLVTIAGYVLAGAALFGVYLRLSNTNAENADMANILLMASDMLHGNLLLHGWHTSDVAFYTTELPQYMLLESFLGARMETAHVAAAMTYTLAFLLAVLLARSGASGRRAAVRTLVAAGIMLAPQLGGGVYALDVAVGHIGTSVPLLAVWLLLDRAGPRWWVPPLAGFLLGWALVADPLVLIAGVLPLGFAAAVQVLKGLVRGRAPWYELGLAAAAAAAPLLASAARWLLRAHGGYVQQPVGVRLWSPHELAGSARSAIWQVLELFGADFRGLHGVQLWLAVSHLVSVALVIAVVLLVTSRFFGEVTLVDQVLVVAVVGLVGAYVFTTASAQGAHEIAPRRSPRVRSSPGRVRPAVRTRRSAESWRHAGCWRRARWSWPATSPAWGSRSASRPRRRSSPGSRRG